MKKLLAYFQRKWPTYLLEVIILIVGIYGAFALENWNDERKERNAEKVILKKPQRRDCHKPNGFTRNH